VTCEPITVSKSLDDIASAGRLGRNSLKHLKVAPSAIFKYAKQLGFFDGENPVRDTAVPPGHESEETYEQSFEEITQILDVLPEPAATIFAVAAFTGARRGEIRGLLWENYHDNELRLTRSVWHGYITEPKTRKSTGAIHVIGPLAKRLAFHRLRSGNPATGPMFANGAGNPMDLNNVVWRVILPALNRCVHCANGRAEHVLADHDFTLDESLPKWPGWHAARRGYEPVPARRPCKNNSILRHANVATTNTYYIKTAAADAQAAMNKLELPYLAMNGNRRGPASDCYYPLNFSQVVEAAVR